MIERDIETLVLDTLEKFSETVAERHGGHDHWLMAHALWVLAQQAERQRAISLATADA